MSFLLPIIVAALVSQQPETLSLLKEPLFAPPVPRKERGRLEAELAEAQAAARKDPSADAALRVARAQRGLGQIGDSLMTLTRAAEGKTESPVIRLERGRGFILIRKFDVAVREFRKADEALPEAHCDIGFALYLLGDYKGSVDEYRQCAKPTMFTELAARRAGQPSKAPAPVPESSDKKDLTGPYLSAVDRLLAHDMDAARDLLEPLVEKHKDRWTEAVYIAAESDYARIAPPAKKKKKKK